MTFNPKEQTTLTALAHAFLPKLKANPANGLYALGAQELNVPAQLIEALANLPNHEDIDQIKLFLALIEKRAANLVIGGLAKPFSQMKPNEQEQFLLKLATSPVPSLRTAFRAIKGLCGAFYFSGLDDNKQNPTWKITGYSGPLNPPPPKPKTIKPLEINHDQTLTCDVVIVGSGAAGGVAAGILAAAGKDVIVIEKGGYYNEADFSQYELESFNKLYLDKGLTASADKGVGLLAGSCLGGGTVVNWSTSFATPEAVRQEWDAQNKFEVFNTDQYEHSSQAILKRLGVSQDYSRLANRDQVMWRGLEKLNWHRALISRNVRGCTQADDCGFCTFGCPHGAKQSTLVTYLQEAYDHNARIIVNCNADGILASQGQAQGIVATTHDSAAGKTHKLTIKAKAVFLAGGAISTPALLLRSGLGGPAVGKYLHLHPTTGIVGYMNETINSWTGVMQGAYSRQFADLDQQGYGAILETGPVHLSLAALAIGWGGGQAFKDLMAKAAHSNPLIIITRDRDTGSVTINRQGLAVVNYKPSKYDLNHARIAATGAIRILEAAGANEIVSLNSIPQIYRPSGSETIEDFVMRLDRQGWRPNQTAFFSYHQMGTARIGSNRETSVVNEYNECHTTRNLYVADSSAFPGASGVNPMITAQTIAHRAATMLASQL